MWACPLAVRASSQAAKAAATTAVHVLRAQAAPFVKFHTQNLHRAAAQAVKASASMAAPVQVAANKCFGGFTKRYSHASKVLGCDMTFSVFFPPGAASQAEAAPAAVPVLYYLSGLTCTDENVIQKAGAQRACAAAGIAFVAPDTSPRGLGVPGESDSWDFGVGAGFYVNATQPKWAAWRMYDYVTQVRACL